MFKTLYICSGSGYVLALLGVALMLLLGLPQTLAPTPHTASERSPALHRCHTPVGNNGRKQDGKRHPAQQEEGVKRRP